MDLIARWNRLGSIPPTGLVDSRLQLHWAAQTVSAVGNSLVETQPDDSQSNLGWSDELGALVGRKTPGGFSAALDVTNFAVSLTDGTGNRLREKRLAGAMLDDVFAWLASAIAELSGDPSPPALTLAGYDMPDHAVGRGAPFSPSCTALEELGRWYADAHHALTEIARHERHATAVRCWPHHFDLGLLVVLDPEQGAETGRSIGLGMSPGDAGIPEPYYYVNPYPRPAIPATLPDLDGGGAWETTEFFGAILRGSALVATDQQHQATRVAAFLRSALARGVELL